MYTHTILDLFCFRALQRILYAMCNKLQGIYIYMYIVIILNNGGTNTKIMHKRSFCHG